MTRAGFGLSLGLLHGAALGAGIMGSAYLSLFPFAALNVLWVAAVTSGDNGLGARIDNRDWAHIGATVAVQLALAAFMLGIGHSLRALFSITSDGPLVPWLVLGVAAILIARTTARISGRSADLDAPAEKALKGLNDLPLKAAARAAPQVLAEEALAASQPTEAEAAHLAAASARLTALPPDGGGDDAIISALAPLSDGPVRLPVVASWLEDRGRSETASTRDRRALILFATDAAVLARAPQAPFLRAAFEVVVAAADVSGLARWLARVEALMTAMPWSWEALPSPARLVEISVQIEDPHPELSEALIALAQRAEDLREESAQ